MPFTDLSRSTLAGCAHLELPSFETSLSYVFGHSPMPGLALDSYQLAGDQSAINVSRGSLCPAPAGFYFSTTLGGPSVCAVSLPTVSRSTRNGWKSHNPTYNTSSEFDREFGPVSAGLCSILRALCHRLAAHRRVRQPLRCRAARQHPGPRA